MRRNRRNQRSSAHARAMIAKPSAAMSARAKAKLAQFRTMPRCYRGHHYRASYKSYRGYQQSLFKDDLKTDGDFTDTNLGTGKKLTFSPLVPYYCCLRRIHNGQCRNGRAQ